MQFGLRAESNRRCNGWGGMRQIRPAVGGLCAARDCAPPAAARTVHFGGRAVAVPAGWPVYRLAEHPRMCVRLDRRAVYLGTPGASQRCPVACGRPPAGDPGRPRRRRGRAVAAPPAPLRHRLRSPAGSDAFTGLGFDACAAPSTRTMSAWASLALPGDRRLHRRRQPRLLAAQPDSTWVGEQVAAGWHLIPTYVGLQAPTSGCSSCAKLSSSLATAAAQGTEAASDAVADAQSVGMGPGSPIYFDMEAYTRTSSASRGDAHLPLAPGPRNCTRSATPPASTAAAPRASPTSAARSAPATCCPTTSGPPTGTAPRTRSNPTCRSSAWASTSASTSTAAATTRPTAG